MEIYCGYAALLGDAGGTAEITYGSEAQRSEVVIRPLSSGVNSETAEFAHNLFFDREIENRSSARTICAVGDGDDSVCSARQLDVGVELEPIDASK